MVMTKYDFAKEFSPIPGPRSEDIGPYSGERFREEVLKKHFEENEPIEIDISGTELSFGPSFLSESFGKIVREYGKEKFYEIVHISETNEKNRKFKDLVEKYIDIALSK